MIGAEDYGDWTRTLLPWERCEPKLAGFCEQAAARCALPRGSLTGAAVIGGQPEYGRNG